MGEGAEEVLMSREARGWVGEEDILRDGCYVRLVFGVGSVDLGRWWRKGLLGWCLKDRLGGYLFVGCGGIWEGWRLIEVELVGDESWC